jgi:hypothetical protein
MLEAVVVMVVANDDRLELHPDWVVLRTGDGRELEWRCLQGRVVVTFPDDSPFHDSEFRVPLGGACRTGVALRGRERRDPYRYTVEARVRGRLLQGEFELFVDP